MMLMRAFVIAAVLCLSGCSTIHPNQAAKSTPVAPEGHSPSDPMFQFIGTWEGKLDGYNAPHFIDGAGFPMTFRIVITPDSVRVLQSQKGEWKEMKPGFFRLNQWGSQAIVSSITSGRDDEGTWVESSSFTLMHHNPDTLIAYWLRRVNNLDIPADRPYYHFAWGNSGEMHRVPDGG